MEKMSYHKKIFIILLIIWLIITFNLIKTTYAKYVSKLDTGTNIILSQWDILLNDKDILSEEDMSEILTLTFPGNEYMKPDVIVPGAVGYFDITIDSSSTTVPFDVIINSSIDTSGSYTDEFSVSGYSINDFNTITELSDGETTFSYNITPDISTTQIRVYVSWIDDGIADEEDTSLGIEAGSALINVKLNFIQTLETT